MFVYRHITPAVLSTKLGEWCDKCMIWSKNEEKLCRIEITTGCRRRSRNTTNYTCFIQFTQIVSANKWTQFLPRYRQGNHFPLKCKIACRFVEKLNNTKHEKSCFEISLSLFRSFCHVSSLKWHSFVLHYNWFCVGNRQKKFAILRKNGRKNVKCNFHKFFPCFQEKRKTALIVVCFRGNYDVRIVGDISAYVYKIVDF